jgi:hypothetical protein
MAGFEGMTNKLHTTPTIPMHRLHHQFSAENGYICLKDNVISWKIIFRRYATEIFRGIWFFRGKKVRKNEWINVHISRYIQYTFNLKGTHLGRLKTNTPIRSVFPYLLVLHQKLKLLTISSAYQEAHQPQSRFLSILISKSGKGGKSFHPKVFVVHNWIFWKQCDLGSMLGSQFSAIFANFLPKIAVFLKSQCYDHFFCKN